MALLVPEGMTDSELAGMALQADWRSANYVLTGLISIGANDGIHHAQVT